MASTLRVQVEQPTRDKKWVAVAIDWPGFERGAKDEAGAIEKLRAYVPRYLPVAKRARLGASSSGRRSSRSSSATVARGRPTSGASRSRPRRSTACRWTLRSSSGTSGSCGRRGRSSTRSRAACRRSFDRACAAVAGLGTEIVRHVLANEGADFAKRVKVPSELDDILPPEGRAAHRDRFVDAMREWYAEGKPLGNWTVPYLLRHTAYHTLDHTWEMEDRDLSAEGAAR